VAHQDSKREAEAAGWLRQHLRPEDPLEQATSLCLTVWKALTEDRPLAETKPPPQPLATIEGKTVEAALLDRELPGSVHYRVLDLA
jgi:hypothetical protein